MSAALARRLRQTNAARQFRMSGCAMSLRDLECDLIYSLRDGDREAVKQLIPLVRGARYLREIAWMQTCAAAEQPMAAE